LEIGLAELHYKPEAEGPTTIFGHTLNDNVITVVQRYTSEISIQKLIGRFENFIPACNIELQRFRPDVKLTLKSDE
jgi:hypothetical protein